jgi:hypothetical protein
VAHKLIRFLAEVPPPDRWSASAAPGGQTVPARVTVSTALVLPGLAPPRFAAVEVLWPTGDDDPLPDPGASADPSAGDGSLVVPVDEAVVRGAEGLAARWADGGERYKMMSFGRRNPALTRPEFVERWRAEAGRLGGDPIPDELRGLAYVQDHPLGDDPPLDAINEVWFDRLDEVRRRAEWFAARPIPADLMSPPDCWSLVLREVVVA